MKKNIYYKIFIPLFILFSFDTFSQRDTIYFSATGDTVLFAHVFYQQIDSLHGSYSVFINRRHPVDTIQNISRFYIITEPANNPWKGLTNDTIKKYHLNYDGIETYPYANKDFNISVKPTSTKLVDSCVFGADKFIYKANVSVKITCKGQYIYSKTFSYMFKGDSPKDFEPRDIVQIKAWQKKNKRKYFISAQIKEFQTIKRHSDEVKYEFKNYLFIL